MMTMKLLYYDDGIVQPLKLFNTFIIFEHAVTPSDYEPPGFQVHVNVISNSDCVRHCIPL